jgi:D-alanine-D-alanine ligase
MGLLEIDPNKKIGVLQGGVSGEREISQQSGAQVTKSLRSQGFKVVSIDIDSDNPQSVKSKIIAAGINLAFVALHGKFGEDGRIQDILEQVKVPYTGSGPEASRKAMDKVETKKVFLNNNIPTPAYKVLKKGDPLPDISGIKVVKPHYAGSSLGVSIVGQQQLKTAINQALAVSQQVVVEDYIPGREITVGILEDRPLEVVEIIPKEDYYNFNAKYKDGATQFQSPAALEPSLRDDIRVIAQKAHKVLGCRNFSRIDMRLSPEDRVYVLEANSIPGLTSHSLLPLSAQPLGIDFDKLIATMIKGVCIYEQKKQN